MLKTNTEDPTTVTMIYDYDGYFPKSEEIDYFCRSMLSIVENWEEATEDIRLSWEENKRLINQKPDPNLKTKADEVNRELHVLPWATASYLSGSVSLKNVLMPNSDYWTIFPRKTDRISKLLADANEKVLKYKQEQNNFKQEFSLAINQAVALGSTAMLTFYDENTVEIREKVEEFVLEPVMDNARKPVINDQGNVVQQFKLDENGFIETETKIVKKEKVLYKGVKNRTIDLKYLAIWPIVGDIGESSKIYSYVEEFENIKNLADKNFYDQEEVEKLFDYTYKNNTSDVNSSLEEFKDFEINKTVAQGIRCRLCYIPVFKFPDNPKIFKRVLAVIAEDRFLLKFQAYPFEYEPITFASLIPNITSSYGIHCIYGLSLIDPMKTSLAIGSALSSLNLDLTSYSLPIVKGHLDDDFKLEPGAEINTDPDQIEIVQNVYSNPYIFQSIGMYKAEGDNVSGMSSLSYPTVSDIVDPNIKATALNLGKQINDAKLKDIATNLSSNLLVPVLKKNIEMTKQTYDAEEVREILFDTEEREDNLPNVAMSLSTLLSDFNLTQHGKVTTPSPLPIKDNISMSEETKFLCKLIKTSKFFMDNYDIKVTGIESTFGKQEQIIAAQTFLGMVSSLGLTNIINLERLAGHIRKITDIPVEIELSEEEKRKNAELLQQQNTQQMMLQNKQEQMALELQKMKMDFELMLEEMKINAQMMKQDKALFHDQKMEEQRLLADVYRKSLKQKSQQG